MLNYINNKSISFNKRKKYINKKYISKENLEILEQEKEALIERENNKCSNKYYDTNKRI